MRLTGSNARQPWRHRQVAVGRGRARHDHDREQTIGGDATFGYTTTSGDGGASVADSLQPATVAGTASTAFAVIGGNKTYTVTEANLPAGWCSTTSSASILFGTQRGGLATKTASIGATGSESITCTFTNRQPGTIRIVKNTDPDGPQDFSFTATGLTPAAFSLDDDADATLSNTAEFTGLTPGDGYAVAELRVRLGADECDV